MRLHASLVLAASFLATTASAQTVLLRYRPPVGKTFSYTMVMSMSMVAPKATQAMAGATHFGQTSPMSIRVLSRTGDTTTVETRSGPAHFDAGSPLAKNNGLTKPVVSRMTLDQYGTPKGAAGGGMPSAMVSAVGQGSQGVAFPKKAVKVGDSWTSALDLGKMMGALSRGMKTSGTIPIVYRLVAVQGGVATVSMTAKGTMSMSMGTRPMRITLDVRSTSLIDVATGMPKSSRTTTDTSTELPGAGGGAVRQHMAMTMAAR